MSAPANEVRVRTEQPCYWVCSPIVRAWWPLGPRRVYWVEDQNLMAVKPDGTVVLREPLSSLRLSVTRLGHLRLEAGGGRTWLLSALNHRNGTLWGASLVRHVPDAVQGHLVVVWRRASEQSMTWSTLSSEWARRVAYTLESLGAQVVSDQPYSSWRAARNLALMSLGALALAATIAVMVVALTIGFG
ncbi:hypothetical protein BA895_09950 [Humibacillus sp. DSM 29435]|uniref:hypothetical protein n=1 Tax=Humibacillus sp. DSM 29435 TaxID=1869167 RepID=UPI000871DD08|nr:hypothetical protein [Humibacillus sp. DSM 29435]OFE14660.1 hypothetical protein BA895_09950 [Humibacillus sp. DSM 29435]